MTRETTSRAERAGTPWGDHLRLPARFGGHSRSLVLWPCGEELSGSLLQAAREEWAEGGRAIARFEPLTVIARPEALLEVSALCGSVVDVPPLPLDDSRKEEAWLAR